jgi:hypothetical protein
LESTRRHFLAAPSPGTAAAFLEALLEVVDLGDLTGHVPANTTSTRLEVQR